MDVGEAIDLKNEACELARQGRLAEAKDSIARAMKILDGLKAGGNPTSEGFNELFEFVHEALEDQSSPEKARLAFEERETAFNHAIQAVKKRSMMIREGNLRKLKPEEAKMIPEWEEEHKREMRKAFPRTAERRIRRYLHKLPV